MKYYTFLLVILFYTPALFAQRGTTKAEQEEDARVKKILSDAMPRELDRWEIEDESKPEGITGFHNDMDFSKKDVFDHHYTISYKLTKASDELQKIIDAAKTANDFAGIMLASSCKITIQVNYDDVACYSSSTPYKTFSSPYSTVAYRDAAKKECTLFFIGKGWTLTPTETETDNGKEYCIQSKLNTMPGTIIQSIKITIESNAEVADMIIKKMDWEKINGLIGTGAIKEDMSETELKKYYPEKPVTPVTGNNFISFTMIAADGTSKDIVISSAKHDLSNGARLRNHHPNIKVLQDAHIDFNITDDKDPNLLFMLSLPVIRTTGTVTATEESDDNYQIMWRGNTDINHSFSPVSIEINLNKWAPPGDFLEGTFSGTATLKDHNDFSTEKPIYTIKNGKFKIRRITDEIR